MREDRQLTFSRHVIYPRLDITAIVQLGLMEKRVKVQPSAYHQFSPCNKSTLMTIPSVPHSLSVLQEGASFSSIFEYSTPKDSCQVWFQAVTASGEKAVIGFQNEQPKIRPKCPTLVTATIGMMWMEPLKYSTSGQSHLVETVLENPGFYQVDLVSWSKAHQYASAHKAVGHARQHFFQNERRLLLVTESGGLRFSRWRLLLTQGDVSQQFCVSG